MRKVLASLLLLALPMAAQASITVDMGPGSLSKHIGNAREVRDSPPGVSAFASLRHDGSDWSYGLAGLAVQDSTRDDCAVGGVTAMYRIWAHDVLSVEIGALAGYMDKRQYTGPMALPLAALRWDLGHGVNIAVRGSYLPDVTGAGSVVVIIPTIGYTF